jgi:hypothetical protein
MRDMHEFAAIIIDDAKTVSVEARVDAENSHRKHCSHEAIST